MIARPATSNHTNVSLNYQRSASHKRTFLRKIASINATEAYRRPFGAIRSWVREVHREVRSVDVSGGQQTVNEATLLGEHSCDGVG